MVDFSLPARLGIGTAVIEMSVIKGEKASLDFCRACFAQMLVIAANNVVPDGDIVKYESSNEVR